MTTENAKAIVLCKWHPTLLTELLALTPEVYVVLDDFDVDHMDPDPELLGRARQVYRVSSFDSIEEIAAVAIDLSLYRPRIDRVVSHTEFSQFGAGYLQLLLDGDGDARKHTAYRDKRLMKERVRAAGVPTTRFSSLAGPDDHAGAERAAAELRFPVVVKPVSGFGTMSTVRVDRPEDLEKVLAEFRFETYLRSKQLMVEEFVPGDEICVDAFWAGGRAVSFLVHAYREPRIAVTAEARRDDNGLDGARVINEADEPELYRRMRALHDGINRGLGIEHGATHLEVFVRPDGEIVFSEIATRVGGGMMPPMLSAYLGRDIWADFARVVVTDETPPAAPRRPHIGAIHLTASRPGVITSMPDEAELAAHPGVLEYLKFREPGSRVALAHPSEWCLILVIGADTAEAYEEVRHDLVTRFRVETAAEDGETAGSDEEKPRD
ncbi:ATP-grasp domain-containing protein [Streptomyces sp. NPDC059814]|uniref:ATP-grasp domain-containing protein n=1 Tax=Streptomyces sp. NPDC059814 TaxID=3346959 RepID=UPI00364C56F1